MDKFLTYLLAVKVVATWIRDVILSIVALYVVTLILYFMTKFWKIMKALMDTYMTV